jgi:undecaprenyl-diphosphatase
VTYFEALVLGIVEGLTEFLPVSSTGHMILANAALGVDPTTSTVKVFLFVSQIGAILAVVVYFWRDLWRRAVSFRPAEWKTHLATKLLVAFLPSVVAGLLLNEIMEVYLERALPVAIALIVGAFFIELIDRKARRQGQMTLDDVTFKQALIVGLAQVISIIPGTSRAGATIMGGMAAGLTPKVAAEFSFYLAIPTMFAAGGFRLVTNYGELAREDFGVIGFGTAVAFGVALLVVAGFMGFVKRYRFTVFAIYRVIIGALVLLALQQGWITN